MSDDQLPWGEVQWSRIRQIVHDEALRTRVAASFLPLYGPLPDGAETAPVNRLGARPSETGPARFVLEIDDYTTQRFASVSVNVAVKNHMLADPQLEAASVLFRRAATIVARVEDHILFNGKDGEVTAVNGLTEPVWTTGGDPSYLGLVQAAASDVRVTRFDDPAAAGPEVYARIIEAVLRIEDQGYARPFAVVLGQNLFHALHMPMPGSMVLPRDSVLPVTEGPLLRASSLDPDQGLVISLLGDPVEIVVPKDISVRYLQAGLDGGHVFRVSQRFLLRVKDGRAVARLGYVDASGGAKSAARG